MKGWVKGRSRGAMSEQHKEAIRNALRGRKITWADKISAALVGSHHTDDARAKMSKAKKGKPGRPMSPENKAKLVAANVGHIVSDETRAKMSDAAKGRPGYWTGKTRGPQRAEWRHNIAVGNKGKPAYYPKRRFYYAGIPFRSSWEVVVAKSFDRLCIEWEYEKKFDLDETQTFRPDFYLPKLNCCWEVKGFFGPKSKRKIDLFREKYPDIPLIVATEPVIMLLDSSFDPREKICLPLSNGD